MWGTGSPLRQFIYNVDLGALMVSTAPMLLPEDFAQLVLSLIEPMGAFALRVAPYFAAVALCIFSVLMWTSLRRRETTMHRSLQ